MASHGWGHALCTAMRPEALKRDLTDSKALLEDIIGAPVIGYRAPSFSITEEVLRVIEDCGYRYDSSYNSFGMHGRYGRVDFSGYPKTGIAYRVSDAFHELPVSNLTLCRRTLPWGGGGYFRLTPFSLFTRGVQKILKDAGAYLFYMHPWEIDPDQPRVNGIPRSYRFRHYLHLDRTFTRLSRLLDGFRDCRFMPLRDYLGKSVFGGATSLKHVIQSDA